MNQQLTVAPSLMGLFGNESVDQGLRLTTVVFGATAAFVPTDFVWDFPTSAADAYAGGVCAATGYRAPGHSLVSVDGVRFIAEFAPRRVSK
ncbi:hypothetical protein [Fimbriimonas ginsengisoli]|uniref:Uncharacterized protein n=1 Tax=Fimbriimonas ginsengisoli Gsoil 348 TaxID=661478 RepID=A0A068NTX6_FIMGI|nr:hypothetical protein [Fimbriimonas ginsengisoli]AIE86988.1 hypothetical protein OP10G_3620 [Fimbriimonas ginsengisoli Gsoil 348]